MSTAIEPAVRAPNASSVGSSLDQLSSLRRVPLFAGLDDAAAEKLSTLVNLREFSAGSTIFRAGSPGESMYLIDQGRIRISVTDADGREAILAELGRGDFFGEMAMIDGHGRSADATAEALTRLAVLERSDFLAFISSDPRIPVEMLAAMTRRLRRTDDLLRHRVARNANAEEDSRITTADRAADKLAEFGGSWKFIGAAICLVIFWIAGNTWMLHEKAFDAFPYVLLNLVFGLIAGLQAPIIMMSQNRQVQKDRLRADLDYQLNLKNELLLTEILHTVRESNDDRAVEAAAEAARRTIESANAGHVRD